MEHSLGNRDIVGYKENQASNIATVTSASLIKDYFNVKQFFQPIFGLIDCLVSYIQFNKY